MKEALIAVLGGLQSLAQSDTRETPVDRLGAIAMAQIAVGRARAESFLVGLGRDAIAFKYGRQPSCREPTISKLAICLGWRRYRLHMRENERLLIARWSLLEWVEDACGVCKGKAEVPKSGEPDAEGAIPMKVCPACGGLGKRRWSDDDSWRSVLPDIPKTARAISVASNCLHDAEALAVRQTAKMCERWGVNRGT